MKYRYRIEANLHGEGFEDCIPATYLTNDLNDAEGLFRYFLDRGVRPVRLIDRKDDRIMMKAENGIRSGC